jgi:hypothetical protein
MKAGNLLTSWGGHPVAWSEWSVARRTVERRAAGGGGGETRSLICRWRSCGVSWARTALCIGSGSVCFTHGNAVVVRGVATCTSWSENVHQRSSEEHIASTFRVQKTMLNSFAAVNSSDITVASLTALSHLHVQDVADREWPVFTLRPSEALHAGISISRIKRPERGANHSPQPSTELKIRGV